MFLRLGKGEPKNVVTGREGRERDIVSVLL